MPRRKREKNEDTSAQQLNLFGSSPEPQLEKTSKQSQLRKSGGKAERLASREVFTNALHDKGADHNGIAQATDAMYIEAFGTGAKGLYRAHDGRRGDRDTLPQQVQDELVVHETLNGYRVQKHQVLSTNQEGVNQELTKVVRSQTRKNKKFFGCLFDKNV